MAWYLVFWRNRTTATVVPAASAGHSTTSGSGALPRTPTGPDPAVHGKANQHGEGLPACTAIARRLNDRPRKRLDFLTPAETYKRTI